MRFLVDTCVISELHKPSPHPGVKRAFADMDDEDIFISVLTIGELAKGVEMLAPGKRKQTLTRWLQLIDAQFAERILPVDAETARLWGSLNARLCGKGAPMPAVDALLAATALRYAMSLMTRNVRHFQDSGVLISDPWNE